MGTWFVILRNGENLYVGGEICHGNRDYACGSVERW